MPFNFGAFAGGLAHGLQQGQELALKKQEAQLRSKMLDAQMKHLDFQNQQLTNTLEQHKQAAQLRASSADALQAAYTGGQPAKPGYESETQQASMAPTPAQVGPNAMTPEQTYQVSAARQGHFFPPHQMGPQHIPENSLVPKAGGGWERAGGPAQPKPITPYEQEQLNLGRERLGATTANTETLRRQQQQFHKENLAQGQQRIDISKERGQQTKDVPKVTNFKDAKTQLEAMAGEKNYKTKDIGKIKPELETQANQLGYTIQSVRPGYFGWNIDIAPVAPSQRGPSRTPGLKTTDKESRLKGLGF